MLICCFRRTQDGRTVATKWCDTRRGVCCALIIIKDSLLWSYIIRLDSLRACNELRKGKDRSLVTCLGSRIRRSLTFPLSVELNPIAGVPHVPNRCCCPSRCVCHQTCSRLQLTVLNNPSRLVVVPVYVMKAYRGSRSIPPLILVLSTKRR